ncbi:MAG: hypothetical protein EOL95_01525 [Bacteroidia bacterium]|nr:hypothetical protein [Bacteroidia bacterium]
MKKLKKSVLLTILLLFASILAAYGGEITIKFQKPATWSSTPHIHMWINETDIVNNQEMAVVPGQSNWYQYTVNTGSYNVIFNDGGWNGQGTNQTNPLYVGAASDVCYTTVGFNSNIVSATCPSGGSGGGITGINIKFKRPQSWDATPNIHIYKASPVSNDAKVIYEINVLNYSSSGNFSAITNDMARLKDLGVDVLWLMPIFSIGVEGRVGVYGSPYATKDYYSVNANYGSLADFKNLVAAAHENGMEVWLDIACNHTAKDNAWVQSHLEYYGYNLRSPFNWNDVYQLDYTYNGTNTPLYNAMTDVLKYWVSECDIDGYRCDYATGVPVSFWQHARTEVDKIKAVTWLCEGDDSNYISTFDMDYAWGFNDDLAAFAGHRTVSTLINECNNLFFNSKYTNKSKMVYLTNHDLSAYNQTEFQRFGDFYLPLLVLSFTIYDHPLLYNGQEIGQSITTFVDKQTINWSNVNSQINGLVKKLISLKHNYSALKDGPNRGTLNNLSASSPNVYAYERTDGESSIIVMLNFSTSSSTFSLNNRPSGTYADYLNGGTMDFSSNNSFTLSANGYRIFVK